LDVTAVRAGDERRALAKSLEDGFAVVVEVPVRRHSQTTVA
jgi:hypothetical protein